MARDTSLLATVTLDGALRVSAYLTLSYLAYCIVSVLYVAFFGPLSKYPGPPLRALSPLPKVLSLWRGTEDSDHVKLHAKYGPIVRTSPTTLSYAGGAQAWKDIYGFRKHGQESIYKDPEFYNPAFNGVSSLITADDAGHSRQRKIISHSFADKTLKEDLEPLLKSWISKLRAKLQEKSDAGEKVDLLKYYNCTTFDIMGDLSFSENLGMLDNGEYSSWVQTIFLGIKSASRVRGFRIINAFTRWITINFVMGNKTVLQKQAEHWDYSAARVQRRVARTPDRPDLWTKVMEKEKEGNGLTLGEYEANASVFMIAGTETTATALAGTTYYLLRNPQYMQKLVQEIREAHNTYEDITIESVQRLKYLHAILQEGLRMYPPVPTDFPRRAPRGGAIICGQYVPEGTVVAVHQLSTYRSEANFKNPYEFRPERWLGDPAYQDDKLSALEPFSVGPRNCIGKNLAWHEMRLILATVLYNFDLQLCDESQNWADQKIFVLWEKIPLMCKLSPAQK